MLDRLEANWINGLKDSKKLSASKRSLLFDEMHNADNIYIGIGIVGPELVDSINVLRASFLAMEKAVVDLRTKVKPEYLLIDGIYKISSDITQFSVVRGDQSMASIAAASIVAKVTRDQIMVEMDKKWPLYGFAKHKGYPTVQHREALIQNGACPIHRTCFKTVKKVMSSMATTD